MLQFEGPPSNEIEFRRLFTPSMPAVGVQVAAQLWGALVDLHGGVLIAVLQILLELGRRGAHLVLDNPIPKGDTVSWKSDTRRLSSLSPSRGWETKGWNK